MIPKKTKLPKPDPRLRRLPTLARSANDDPPVPVYPGDQGYPKGIKIPVIERKDRS